MRMQNVSAVEMRRDHYGRTSELEDTFMRLQGDSRQIADNVHAINRRAILLNIRLPAVKMEACTLSVHHVIVL